MRYMFFEFLGNVLNLSSTLWHMTSLTGLYINDNQLTQLPPDISNLVNLQYLDMSRNNLRSLPAELGELIYLR